MLVRIVQVIYRIERGNHPLVAQHADVVQQRGAKDGLLLLTRQLQRQRELKGDQRRALHMQVEFGIDYLYDASGKHQC